MRVIGTVVAAIFYAIGWLAGIVAVAIEWVWSAVAVGWADAHRTAARRGHARGELHAVPDPEPTVPAWPAERAR